MKSNYIINVILRRINVLLIIILIFSSLITSFTFSKYVIKEKVSYNDDDKIDFTVNSVFVVSSADELFAAINQGYSYVQLDKEIENPLIITQKAENLNNDLIIDLNGVEIQRNGYDPILNINTGVRLTIVDSSDEQTGGLYNPVGSVFNINGGMLTIVTGSFESGPRYSEYYSYNNEILNNDSNSETKRTIVEDDAQQVKYYVKNDVKVIKAPIIKSYPVKIGDVIYNHGNMYFDENVTKGSLEIKADTYCYYRTSLDSAITEVNTTMADWYYSYYVDSDTYKYTGYVAQKSSDIKVTIYGYEGVIEKASEIEDATDYYAAIQMSSGELDVQDGSFYQYFGIDKTACVNAQGGAININQGNFSSRIPNAITYESNSVYVKESDKDAFYDNYFNNFKWYTSYGTAKYGESHCILNAGKATVTVNSGMFYSSNNNVISMQGGNLTINHGSFVKKLTNNLSGSLNNADYSAINMQNGTLSITNSNFNIYGDNTYAIYSTVSGNESFRVENTNFSITGDNSIGIYSANGKVIMKSTNNAQFMIDGKEGKGIFVEEGGSVDSYDYSYYLEGKSSYGIYSSSGMVGINGGNIYLLSNESCYGIYAVSSEEININVKNVVIAVGCSFNNNNLVLKNSVPEFPDNTKNGENEASVGVYMLSENEKSKLSITNSDIYCYEVGVVSAGGKIEFDETGKIITHNASAIAIKNGDINFKETSNYTIISSNTTTSSYQNTYTLTLPIIENGKMVDKEYVNTDGIYVDGGSFSSSGTLNITHTGLQNNTNNTLISNYDYTSLVVTSYAVRVYGGDVRIKKCQITANSGGGIYSGKKGNEIGAVVLGSNGGNNDNIKIYTLGNEIGDQYYAIGTDVSESWRSYKSITGGHAVEVAGGSVDIYNGIYEAQYGNGIFVNGDGTNTGVINIYNGEFYGYMNNNKNKPTSTLSGPSAYYGLKVIGGSIVNIFNGLFDGGNGGAFVTGVTKISNQNIISSSTAKVYIYEGTFGSSVGCRDAFNVYDDVYIVFGAYKSSELDKMSDDEIKNLIKLYASQASIAANSITNTTSSKNSEIYVYYGTYGVGLWRDTKLQCTWETYNTKLEYVNATGNIEGEQNNTTKKWYN